MVGSAIRGLGQRPHSRRQGGRGAWPPALGDFAIFFAKVTILGLF